MFYIQCQYILFHLFAMVYERYHTGQSRCLSFPLLLRLSRFVPFLVFVQVKSSMLTEECLKPESMRLDCTLICSTLVHKVPLRGHRFSLPIGHIFAQSRFNWGLSLVPIQNTGRTLWSVLLVICSVCCLPKKSLLKSTKSYRKKLTIGFWQLAYFWHHVKSFSKECLWR